MMKHDGLHGKFPFTLKSAADILIINEKKEKKIAENSLSLDDEINESGEIANE